MAECNVTAEERKMQLELEKLKLQLQMEEMKEKNKHEENMKKLSNEEALETKRIEKGHEARMTEIDSISKRASQAIDAHSKNICEGLRQRSEDIKELTKGATLTKETIIIKERERGWFTDTDVKDERKEKAPDVAAYKETMKAVEKAWYSRLANRFKTLFGRSQQSDEEPNAIENVNEGEETTQHLCTLTD